MNTKLKVLMVLILLTLFTSVAFVLLTYAEEKSGQKVTQDFKEQIETTIELTDIETLHVTVMPIPTSLPTNSPTPIPSPTLTPTPTQTPTPTPTLTPTPTPVIIDILISAVGDVTLGSNQKQGYEKSFHEYYDTYGEDYFLKNVNDIFLSDDFTIVNLEGTLTDSDNIRATKQWNHKGRPEYAGILSNHGVDAVTLGNNHIMDYQEDGVLDTINNVKLYHLEYALSGPWGNHYGLFETEKGIKIGFVSVNEYYDGEADYEYLEDGYRKLREAGADLVFACTHWGGDKTHIIEDDQYKMGRWCIDLGYDLVLGCHPHVLQGIEYYKGRYIVYSMGNFCYGGNKNPAEKSSMIFQQKFTFINGVIQENSSIRVIPCRLSSVTTKNDYCPVVLTGEDAIAWAAEMNGYCEEFGLKFDTEGYLTE